MSCRRMASNVAQAMLQTSPIPETGGTATRNSQGRMLQFATSRPEVRSTSMCTVRCHVPTIGSRDKLLDEPDALQSVPGRGRCGASPFSGQAGRWGAPPISLAAASGPLTGWFTSSPAMYRSGRLAEDGDCEISTWSRTSVATSGHAPCAVKASCPLLRKSFSAD